MTITGADNKVGTELTASVTGNTHILFQFTPLREGRPLGAPQLEVVVSNFNSRPCERGDAPEDMAVMVAEIISIHAPARGATEGKAATIEVGEVFQFTPLREGRRYTGGRLLCFPVISIHAPARGATRSHLWVVLSSRIFQFTPLREGRLCALHLALDTGVFQFTPLREGRPRSTWPHKAGKISIHAPARGATPRFLRSKNSRCRFQFTPLREGRQS